MNMHFVIPMAGASSRFYDAGYRMPKYALPVRGGLTLFDLSVGSFSDFYGDSPFTFIVRDTAGIGSAAEFASSHAESLGIRMYEVSVLDECTRGQAETVHAGLAESMWQSDGLAVAVFNIDTIRHNFGRGTVSAPAGWDAVFEVFRDGTSDERWSFAKFGSDMRITETAEKRRISDWCSDGLYVFRDLHTYEWLYGRAVLAGGFNYYVAPMYNFTPNAYACICDRDADLEFAGIPEEYERLAGEAGRPLGPR